MPRTAKAATIPTYTTPASAATAQDYEPLPSDDSTIHWVHFNGVSAREIQLDTGLNAPIVEIKKSEEIYELFHRLIVALKSAETEEKNARPLHFAALFCRISKAKKPDEKNKAESAKKKRLSIGKPKFKL